ncbi:33633_t:CDS:1, partial [Gigaspora margarita]
MNLKEVNSLIRQIPACNYLMIPIKTYKNITPTINLLRTHFQFRSFLTRDGQNGIFLHHACA